MVDTPDEEVLKTMGRLLKLDSDSLDPRLERLAAGELSADELAALEADAATDPKLARDLELHRPLSPDLRSRLMVIAEAGMTQPVSLTVVPAAPDDDTAKERPGSPRAPQPAAPPASASESERPEDDGPKESSIFRTLVPVFGLALAAGVALVMLRGPAGAEPLPPYRFHEVAGDEAVRGGEPAPAAPKDDRRRVREDSYITLAMAPKRAVRGETMATLLIGVDGAWHVSSAKPERLGDGVFKFYAPAKILSDGRMGAIDLVMRISRPGIDPPEPAGCAPAAGDGWYSQGISLSVYPRRN